MASPEKTTGCPPQTRADDLRPIEGPAANEELAQLAKAVGHPARVQRGVAALLGESVLGQMAAAHDCFAQRDENTYLLCFASGNSAVAELRATMMAQALRASLLRGLPDQVVSVRVE